ncbi:ADP-ribosylation factor GTPase activating protein, ER-Golgi transport [Thecaphora frezii]
MGVHITFVRSINLDSWHWSQLRLMKVGGNAAASEFFNRKGGSQLLNPSTEGKVKYTSSVAQAYKEELQKRALQDAAGQSLNSPVYFPGLAAAAPAVSAASNGGAAGGDDDDFFDEWDKPAGTTAATAKPKPAPALAAAKPAAAPAPKPVASPRTVTSSSLRATGLGAGRKGLGAVSRSSSASSTPGTTTPTGASASGSATPAARPAGRAGKLGLGVKKAGAPIDFDAVERKAKEEEAAVRLAAEQAKQQQEKEAEEAKKAGEAAEAERIAREAVQAATSKLKGEGGAASSSSSAAAAVAGAGLKGAGGFGQGDEVDRLGMGFGRLGMKANAHQAKLAAERAAAASRNASASADSDGANGGGSDDVSYARQKFASQKSISSDQYFERGGYDPNLSSGAKARLANFAGQTSISSNQYFGREEEDDEGGNDGLHAAGREAAEFGSDLEATAREYYRKFMANPDVQSSIESFRTGALKLSQYLEEMSRNGA